MAQNLSALALGSILKFGRYKVEKSPYDHIAWKVIAQNGGSTTLIANKVLDVKPYDANLMQFWELSDLRQWLNSSNSDGNWFSQKYTSPFTDDAPTEAVCNKTGYANQSGFLYGFSTYEKDQLITTSNTSERGYYNTATTVNDKVWLPTLADVIGNTNINKQCYVSTQLGTYNRLGYSTSTYLGWFTRTPYSYSAPDYMNAFSSTGTQASVGMNSTTGIRPVIALSSTLQVSDSADSVGYYLVGATAPVISAIGNTAIGNMTDNTTTFPISITSASSHVVLTAVVDSAIGNLAVKEVANADFGNTFYQLSTEDWKKLSYGSHTIVITSWDKTGLVGNTATFTFTKFNEKNVLGKLSAGAKIKFANYSIAGHSAPLKWTLLDFNHAGHPNGSATLWSEEIIDFKSFDSKNNYAGNVYGSNHGLPNFRLSNIRMWLNSSASAGNWWSAIVTGKYAPSVANLSYNTMSHYEDQAGFLNGFTQGERDLLLPLTHTTYNPYNVNNVVENPPTPCTDDKVFLLGQYEIFGTGNGRGTPFSYLSTAGLRTKQVSNLAKTYSAYGIANPSITSWKHYTKDSYSYNSAVYFVDSAGATAYATQMLGDGQYGVAPAIILSQDTVVSDSVDGDGYYSVVLSTPVDNSFDTKRQIKLSVDNSFDTHRTLTAISTVDNSFDTYRQLSVAVDNSFDTQRLLPLAVDNTYDTKRTLYLKVDNSFDTHRQVSVSVDNHYDTHRQIKLSIDNSFDTKRVLVNQANISLTVNCTSSMNANIGTIGKAYLNINISSNASMEVSLQMQRRLSMVMSTLSSIESAPTYINYKSVSIDNTCSMSIELIPIDYNKKYNVYEEVVKLPEFTESTLTYGEIKDRYLFKNLQDKPYRVLFKTKNPVFIEQIIIDKE